MENGMAVLRTSWVVAGVWWEGDTEDSQVLGQQGHGATGDTALVLL